MPFKDVPDARRRIMRAIRSSETKPEALLRSGLHRLGFRFRKNERALPGKPDIVFAARKKVIFVHGCFWHQHADCAKIKSSRVRTEYWEPKLARNVERDRENVEALRRLGWSTKIIWECEIKRNLQATVSEAKEFLQVTTPAP